jgi:hypothetical protein
MGGGKTRSGGVVFVGIIPFWVCVGIIRTELPGAGGNNSHSKRKLFSIKNQNLNAKKRIIPNFMKSGFGSQTRLEACGNYPF